MQRGFAYHEKLMDHANVYNIAKILHLFIVNPNKFINNFICTKI